MIVVYGSFNADYVWRTARLPAPGETRMGEFSSAPGGKGFNQAVAAHRLGAQTVFVGAVGRDAGGRMARTVAGELGLACRFLESDQPTGSACVVVDDEGRNQIVVAPGANWVACAADLAFAHAQFQTAAVVVAQLECATDSVIGALQRGRAAGALTILNPAPAPAVLERGLLEHVDVLTPNETEFDALLTLISGAPPMPCASRDDASLHAACRALLAGTVVVTLGAAGAFVSHGQDRRGDALAFYRVATPGVTAIDTTGAGDCFNGALAASLLGDAGHPFAGHVAFACHAAALSTETEGAALSMPSLETLKQRFPALDR